jgi:short-subunit dehydrogenase
MSLLPVCFITGASSGFGVEFAKRMAREGYAVGLSARREERLREVAAAVEAEGGQAGVYPCDVAQRDQVLTAVRACEEELGPVDLLIANAGLSINTLVRELDVDAVERVIRVNLLGAIYATEGVLPGMLERDRGHIVAVSSLAGMGGLPKGAAYSASKAGMINFFESLRLDLLGTGVATTVISPGFVKTPMTDHNRHPMPFLMELDPAMDLMVRAIRKRRKALIFPWPLATLAWVARIFPRALYDRIAGDIKRDKAPQAEYTSEA